MATVNLRSQITFFRHRDELSDPDRLFPIAGSAALDAGPLAVNRQKEVNGGDVPNLFLGYFCKVIGDPIRVVKPNKSQPIAGKSINPLVDFYTSSFCQVLDGFNIRRHVLDASAFSVRKRRLAETTKAYRHRSVSVWVLGGLVLKGVRRIPGIVSLPRQSLIDIPHDLARELVFPGPSLLYRPIEGNGSGMLAVYNATATVPALVRVQNDGRAALFGIRDEDVHLANIHAGVASDTKFRIKNYRRVRSCDVWQSADFNLSHCCLPAFCYGLRNSPCCEPRSWLSCLPNNAKVVPPV